MSALKDAGLMMTPCTELGFEGGKWSLGDTHEDQVVINLSVCVHRTE